MELVRSKSLLFMIAASLVVIVAVLSFTTGKVAGRKPFSADSLVVVEKEWRAPHSSQIPYTAEGAMIAYGRELIANTSAYLGPKGKIAAITNGMNCQNCHLEAGTRIRGNNYGGVYSTYPLFRQRSGGIETIYKRVNDCLQRSLASRRTLDTNSREMRAIYSYIRWVGQEVPRGIRPAGAGLEDIAYLDRAADPEKGAIVYRSQCQRCHGAKGEGQPIPATGNYLYPPLWGDKSYTTAAGLFRVGRFASFVKYNMPFDAPAHAKNLSDEEAWDVAAFVNSQPRPVRVFAADWPNIAGKPVDHPFGPYADEFTEEQHKYGPFKPILEAAKKRKEASLAAGGKSK